MFSSRDMGGEFLSSREFMGSDLFLNQTTTQQQQQNQHHHPPHPPPQQGGGGLARYRSAPSSFLAALLDSTATENSSSGDESEAIFSALMGGQKNGGGGGGGGVDDQMQQQQFHQMKQEVVVESEPRPGSMNGQMGSVVGSYSVGMDSGVDLRMNSNTSSINLLRQSSSPAGFFNGFGVMGDVGNYRVQSHAKPNSSSANHNMNFSSGPSSSSRFMPSIPENDQLLRNRNNNNTSANNNTNGGREFEDVNFPQDSWNHSPPFNSLKRNRDGDPKMFSNFNGFENQNGESRKNSSGLVHHLSLPKTSNEMAEVEKYLHFQQDTTPCQIRAKRGFATHPRSIAERVRRTRISEKMRKLQDLFPTMDKQTSTADMLDSAVEFIKELQKQVQTLTDIKGKCICSNKPQ